jgi:hypothetical protein
MKIGKQITAYDYLIQVCMQGCLLSSCQLSLFQAGPVYPGTQQNAADFPISQPYETLHRISIATRRLSLTALKECMHYPG